MNKKVGVLRIFTFVAVSLLLLAGSFYLGRVSVRHSQGIGKLASIMELIRGQYVDTISVDSIQEATIPLLLSQLDPHSLYLPASINASETERLEGSFSGIGIQFNTLLDTVVVVSVLPGSPSARADLRAGDRILRANDKPLTEPKMPNDSIMAALKGPKGSVVSLDVVRDKKPLVAKVVRGDVPVKTIDAAYEMTQGIVYIRINSWGRTTLSELLTVIATYSTGRKGSAIKGLVIDLRGNVGGYFDVAVEVSNEFLQKGQMIVYTQGRAYPREDFYANGEGMLKEMPLTVLVDENSASSSEIFAGAMQDHDRALIIGRRTFGKGLVQRPFDLSDGSVVRLTVARYYTPSGRSIQKPYTYGDAYDYRMDLQERFVHGEFYSADSIRLSARDVYKTDGGREVYDGGGIMPDVFVPMDTLRANAYYQRLVQRGIIPEFAFVYTDQNRAWLNAQTSVSDLLMLLKKQQLIYKIAEYATRQGVPMRPAMMHECSDMILTQLYAFIADYTLGRNAFYEILNSSDPMLTIAIERLKAGSWAPLYYGQKDSTSRLTYTQSLTYPRLAFVPLGLRGGSHLLGSLF